MSPPSETFGRFHIALDSGGDVVLRRDGILGRGGPAMVRAWSVEQVAELLRLARIRRGSCRAGTHARQDAVDECKALEWALVRMRVRESGGRNE